MQQHDYGLFYKQEIEGRENVFLSGISRVLYNLHSSTGIKGVAEAAAKMMSFALNADYGKFLMSGRTGSEPDPEPVPDGAAD